MGRAPCCDKTKVKKGPWAPEEDAKLKSYIDKHGTGGNWIALPQKIGLKRCGKSCRLRWLNYLRPNIKHGGFSEEEDNIICSLYVNIGSRWSIIAAQLPGRTDNDIKNYWNTRLKKKLLGKQRKEQQAQNRRERDQVIKITNNNATNFQLIPPPHPDNINGFGVVNQLNPYRWVSELPAVLPVTSTTSYQQANAQLVLNNVDHHQASIKNMLIKLGGRFSDHTSANSMYLPPPMEDHIISSTPSDQFYQSSHLDNILTQLGPSDPAIFNAATDLEAELRELVYGNMSSTPSPPCHQLDGPAGNFYQMEMPGTTSTSAEAAPESEISWGDINSLVYCATTTPMVSDYEHISYQQLQEGVRRQSDSAFTESIYSALK